jgi:serine/threonine protein kinase
MDETKNVTETEGSHSPQKGSGASLEKTKSVTHTDLLRSPVEGLGESARDDPSKIGRYTILGRLGQGGFGRVYLAHDDELRRHVAIKVPNAERISRPMDVEAYLNEARILAKLDHPNIVPVHDVGRTDDGLCYVVSKLIEGRDLAVRIGQARLSIQDSAELVATVADALHYAHTRGLVHRDIKPANILIEASGKPCVADFGVALKDEDFGKSGGVAGTPAYMSPEVARGEGHRVDGRSDIFSLGVVLYELLTGRRPFRGDSPREIIEALTQTEPRPPRQTDDTIPKELERICLKALSKRASERYTTARDMAEDLRLFLLSAGATGSPVARSTPESIGGGSTLDAAAPPVTFRQSDSFQRPIKIVPKGLRSFDEQDAEFFLELLPGPRDRDGLPEGIRFWKSKIEQIDPDQTFRVGMICGPSGCGKSSLVKAGLLPRLAKHVRAVYIEATPEETETRLLRGLHKACPGLPQELGLADALAQLRRGRILPPERKALLVLDHFEQRLHAKGGNENTELVTALRHCDGEHVQTIVMVRDDFWLAASRFMRDLEIRLAEGENSAVVDLFDPRHARKVLIAFGQAYGALPDTSRDLNREQESFLDQSISGLARDGKIISVRLALFAEMMKGKPWTPGTLREVGGTEGVGLTFLDETFSASSAPPEHRHHQKAAQAVLKALLPESGTDIKGQMRSRSEMMEASGYASRPRDFDDLLRILDPELRLITPTDPEGSSEERLAGAAGSCFYQLTHDYLVHSLRDWLTRKQRETRRGRAELRLAERTASWNAKPENRQLPSLLEWANIRLSTRKKDWTDPQRRMMKQAKRVHGSRIGLTLILLGAGVLSGIAVRRQVALSQQVTHAAGLVQRLLDADTLQVPEVVGAMREYRQWVDPALKSELGNNPDGSREKLHASLALLPVDSSQIDYLLSRLIKATPGELSVLRDALKTHQSALTPKLWKALESAKPGDASLLPSAGALVSFVPDDARWETVCNKVAQAMVSLNPVFLGSWLDAFRPVRSKLNPPLAAIFREESRPETEHALATSILADYAKDDPNLIADLVMDADPKAYALLFPVAQRQEAKTLPIFHAELEEKTIPAGRESDSAWFKNRLARRQARAAVALVRLGHSDGVWRHLQHNDDPQLRSFIVNWLNPLGADPQAVAAALERMAPGMQPTHNELPKAMDAILFDPETSIRRALILALGMYGPERLPASESEPLFRKLLHLYRHDPDSGIHGAAAWTLSRWKQQEKLNQLDAELMKLKSSAEQRWYVNGQRQTFAVINGPVEFHTASATPEAQAAPGQEPSKHLRIARRFAIAATEVTVTQFQRFLKLCRVTRDRYRLSASYLTKYSPDPEGPWIALDWYAAAHYCNWLSEQEGLPKDQWCYLPDESGAYAEGKSIPADFLDQTYRSLEL